MLYSAFVTLSVFVAAAQAGLGKRGLCWAWYNAPLDPGLFNNGNGEVVAIYDYETYQPPSSNGAGGLDFIGMQRCLDCSSSPIADLQSRLKEQQWDTLFTLNEPDINGIGPEEAAAWYTQNINNLPVKKALPSVTSSTDPNQGLGWLSKMINACAGQCSYDYINLHWYGGSFDEFQKYIESAHQKFPDIPMVVTEFALGTPNGDQVGFLKQAVPFLDEASYVHRYFPFLASSPELLEKNDPSAAAGLGTGSCLYNNDGTISPAGEVVLALSTGNTGTGGNETESGGNGTWSGGNGTGPGGNGTYSGGNGTGPGGNGTRPGGNGTGKGKGGKGTCSRRRRWVK